MKNRLTLKKWRRWLPAALYAGCALVWLCGGLLGLAQNRTGATQVLLPSAAATEGLLYGNGNMYVSENEDPKLIFEGIGHGVRYVRLNATFTADPGELDLFYTTKPGQGFSVQKRVIGAPQADGTYLYTLPPFTTVQALRIDLGTKRDNGITVADVQLDPALPAAHFLAPTLRTVVGLAALPALALCAIYTIIEWYSAAKKWRAKRKVTT